MGQPPPMDTANAMPSVPPPALRARGRGAGKSKSSRRRHSMGSSVPNGAAPVNIPGAAAAGGPGGQHLASSPQQPPMASYANASDPAALQQQDKFLGWRTRWRQSGSFRSSIQSLDSNGTGRGSDTEGDDDDDGNSRASQSGSKRNLLELLGAEDAQGYYHSPYSPLAHAHTPNKRLSIEGGMSPVQLSHMHPQDTEAEVFTLDMMGSMHVSSNVESDLSNDPFSGPPAGQGPHVSDPDTFARMLSAVSEGEGDRAESFDALACKSDGRVLMRGSGGVELPLRLPSTGSNQRAPMHEEDEGGGGW